MAGIVGRLAGGAGGERAVAVAAQECEAGAGVEDVELAVAVEVSDGEVGAAGGGDPRAEVVEELAGTVAEEDGEVRVGFSETVAWRRACRRR